MALPTSGPISLSMIRAVFGGAVPDSLSEYYAGLGLVPAGTSGTNGPVPSSGPISFSHFYGTSNAPPVVVRLTDTSKFVQSTNAVFGNHLTSARAIAGLGFTSFGQMEALAVQHSPNWFVITPTDEWMTPNGSDASLYQIRATTSPAGLQTTGEPPTTWVSLVGGRQFSIEASQVGVGSTTADTGNFVIQIRRASDGVVIASCVARLQAVATVDPGLPP